MYLSYIYVTFTLKLLIKKRKKTLLLPFSYLTIKGSIINGGIYIKQTLDFKLPVFVDEKIIAKVEILKIKENRKLGHFVTFSTKVYLSEQENKLALSGEGLLLIPHDSEFPMCGVSPPSSTGL